MNSDQETPTGVGMPGDADVVIAGNPTDEEAAAVAALLAALAAAQEVRPLPKELTTIAGGWRSYWRVVRSPLHAGLEAWRGSYRALRG